MSFDEEHLYDHFLCQREVAERDERIRELEAKLANRTEKDWERLLEANYSMSDQLASFRLLPCQCPKCGHEHMANVRGQGVSRLDRSWRVRMSSVTHSSGGGKHGG
jgi:hypothetical protein